MRERARGFTLVELMIVVAIIALIATIGFPTYRDSVQKSKRAEAKSRLLQIAQLQERNFTQNNTYTTNIAGLLSITGTVYSSDTNDTNSGYQITAAVGSTGSIADSFLLTATRQTNMAGDTECGNLMLASSGQKTISGTGTLARCWG